MPHLAHISGPSTWVQATCFKPTGLDVRGLMTLERCAVALALCRSWQWVQMLMVTEVMSCGFLPVRESTLGKPALLLRDVTPNHSLIRMTRGIGLSACCKHTQTLSHPSRGSSIQASVSGLLKMDGKRGGQLECLNLFAQLLVY